MSSGSTSTWLPKSASVTKASNNKNGRRAYPWRVAPPRVIVVAFSTTGTPRSQYWSFCFHTIPATPSPVEMVTPVTSWMSLAATVPVSTTASDHV